MEDYSQYLIKDYLHWSVFIHQNQSYLGRYVIWCKRNAATELAGANSEEQEELFLILKELQQACNILFKPDWYNYTFLGNETPHLHGHFIPRYKREVNYAGQVFVDQLFGHHYRTNPAFKIPDTVLFQIRDVIREKLIS